MCMRKECSASPEFYPVLVAYTPGVGESRMVVGLELCLACKAKVEVPTDVLKDPSPIFAALKADSVRIDFCRMRSKEGLTFQKQTKRTWS